MLDQLPNMRAITDSMIAVRHKIHSEPELGFEEHKTSELVANLLTEWGYSVTRGLGVTGVVGQLKNGDGPSLGLRADMDALPIHEETGLPYASKIAGKMHACGHDGHTATLLAAAKYLSDYRNFQGTINLFFQPAEEGLGGARKMIEDGLFQQFPCDAVFGFHNMPGYPVGHFGFHAGPTMASSDTVTIKVKGHGGHGAMPHLSIDPVVIASSIVMSLQTIVSRNINPLAMAVISVGSIHAGIASNVIPEEAEMKLTVRNLDPKTQDLVEAKIKEIAEFQAKSFGGTAEVVYERRYPILCNHPKETEFAENLARELLGDMKIIPDFPAITASEDFSFMMEKCSGSYIFVGNGIEGAYGCSVHNPKYNFNDEILPIVASYWVLLANKFCSVEALL